MRIKSGDIVGIKSYNKDIYFIVDKIIINKVNKQIALLKGLNIRIIADSNIDDLELFSVEDVINTIYSSENRIEKRIKNCITNNKRIGQNVYTGKILHLDGDRKYSEKSMRYYNKIGLNAIVKNIAENKQANVVVPLLKRYNPDILIITGHDAMFKKGRNYSNIYNYRNSRHFINTVKEARTWGKNSSKLVIFARRLSKLL